MEWAPLEEVYELAVVSTAVSTVNQFIDDLGKIEKAEYAALQNMLTSILDGLDGGGVIFFAEFLKKDIYEGAFSLFGVFICAPQFSHPCPALQPSGHFSNKAVPSATASLNGSRNLV